MHRILFLLSFLLAYVVLPAQSDCDGTPPAEFYQSVLLCTGDTLWVGPVKLTQAGNFQTQLETTAGCDSIVYTYLELLPSYDLLSFRALCPGDSFRGQNYERDTVLVESFTTTAGCDSTLRYELDVIEGPTRGIEGAAQLCADAETELTAPPGYADYLWNTGANTAAISAGPGDYRVTVTNSIGCAFELASSITGYQPMSEVDWRGPACPGSEDGSLEVLLTTGGLAPYTYELEGVSAPSADTLFTGLAAGDYRLKVADALGCTEVISFTLSPPDDAQADLLGLPTEPVTVGDTVALQLLIDTDYTQLRWTAQGGLSCYDCPNPIWTPGGDGSLSYTLLIAAGCSQTGEYHVELVDPQRIYFPNAFSPNGDDQNDFYQLGTADNVALIADWRVYDRWGVLVARATGVPPDAALWDGRTAGRAAPAGVYVYAATVVFANGSTETFGGALHLLR